MTVKIRLTSSLNISFDHEIDTEIPAEEWADMSRAEKLNIFEEIVWEAIEVTVEDEED